VNDFNVYQRLLLIFVAVFVVALRKERRIYYRLYDMARFSSAVCLSVCLSVRPSHAFVHCDEASVPCFKIV